MHALTVRIAVIVASVLGATQVRAQSGVRTVELKRKLNQGRGPLKGFVDLHTHPLNHISFGGKLLHGAPDTGIWMPRDMRGCGTPAGPAITREQALGACDPTHQILANGCGNFWRGAGIFVLEG
jgi:hypothetical protein